MKRMKTTCIIPFWLRLFSCSILPLLCAGEAKRAELPNVIVIVTDDQGWADLGVHQVVPDIHTPHLDALAKSGISFSAGYVTAPQCGPSRAGLITGIYQQRFGVDDNRFAPLQPEQVTLAERLQEAGYVTGMVGKWGVEPQIDSEEWLRSNHYTEEPLPPMKERHISYAKKLPYFPGNQGFDHFFSGYIWDYWANYDLDGNQLAPQGELVKMPPSDRIDIQTEAALTFVQAHNESPFFLYLSYFAPHVPLASSEKYLSRFPGKMPERRRHALAMLAAVDEGVGRLREQLSSLGILDNTIIFYLSDNGAPLKIKMEDRPISFPGGAWDGSLNVPFCGEKGMLSEGGIRVPFLFSWPAQIPSGQVLATPVMSLDIAATVLAAAGLPSVSSLDGSDIVQLLEVPCEARSFYWRFWGQGAMRSGDWKYLCLGEKEMLFNLAQDPEEKKNLIDHELERLQTMREQWSNWNKTLMRPFDGYSGINSQESNWFSHYFYGF